MPHINAKDFKDSWSQSDWEWALRRLDFIKKIENILKDSTSETAQKLKDRHAEEKAKILAKYPMLAKE